MTSAEARASITATRSPWVEKVIEGAGLSVVQSSTSLDLAREPVLLDSLIGWKGSRKTGWFMLWAYVLNPTLTGGCILYCTY